MKTLLAHRCTLTREGLDAVLRALDPHRIRLDAEDGGAALACADAHRPFDLALIEAGLPPIGANSVVRALRDRAPTLPIVLLARTAAPTDLHTALANGASAVLPTTLSLQGFASALRALLAGAHASGGIEPGQVALRFPGARVRGMIAPGLPGAIEGLTSRQMQVLRLMTLGMDNKTIARSLGLAQGTVKCHVSRVLEALNVRSRTQAVIRAAGAGLPGAPSASPSARIARPNREGARGSLAS